MKREPKGTDIWASDTSQQLSEKHAKKGRSKEREADDDRYEVFYYEEIKVRALNRYGS